MSRKNPSNPMDITIKCGILVTMVPDTPVLRNTLIHISDGCITSIETWATDTRIDTQATELIDAGNCLVMPGLVNAHTHAAMTMFRGLADDMPLKKWLFEKIFPAEAKHLSPENVYWASLLAFAEMITSGTTCFSDGYFCQDKTMEAAHNIGIRGVVAQGVIDFPAPGVPDPSKNLEVAQQFIDRWRGLTRLLTPSLFCHSPVTCSDKTLKGAMEICLSEDIPMQIHLSETIEEVENILSQKGTRPAYYLDDLGILNETLIAVHCVHLDRDEMNLVKERGTKVVHCPESNMKLVSGICPAWQMIKMEIDLGLGTDGCASNNDLDMFTEMDMAAKLSKVSSRDPTALNAEQTLRMATTMGARVLGLGDEIGTIEPGKRADIIVLDLNNPRLQPVYDPISTVVYSASGGDVRDVIIDGRIIMRDQNLITIDLEEVMWEIRRIAEKIR